MILNLAAEMWSFVLVTVVVILRVGAEEVISQPDDYATIPDTSKQGGSQDGLPETLEPPAKPLLILPTEVNSSEVSPDQSKKNSLEDTKNTKPELPVLLIKLTENLNKPALPDMTKEEEKPSVPTLTRKKRTFCLKCGGGGSHKHGGGGYGGGGYGGGGYGGGGYGGGCGSGGCGGRGGGCGPGGCGGRGGGCGSGGCNGGGGSYSHSSSSSDSSSGSWGRRK